MPKPQLAYRRQPQPLAIDDVLRARAEIKSTMNRLQGELSRLDADILKAADENDGELDLDDFKVSVVNGQSQDIIRREILLQLGVKLAVIRKATTPGTKFRYPRITDKRKQAEAKAERKARRRGGDGE